jgi:hypothetical protein
LRLTQSHRGQRLALSNRSRHCAAYQFEKSLAIFRIPDAPRREFFRGAHGEKGGLELGMGTHRLAHINLRIAKLAGEPHSVGKELDRLHSPPIAVRVVFALADDMAFPVPNALGHRDGLARDALSTDEISNLHLGGRAHQSALEILPP